MGILAVDLAIVAAAIAAIAALIGAKATHKAATTRRVASAALVACAALAGISVAVLGRALWRVDPALTYVTRHASRETPAAYRIAGIWGGMEGSLLFWATIVAAVFAAATAIARTDRLALAGVGGATTALFLFVSRRWASPFEKLEVPSGSGDGLLAVLQHPAMVYHPPILYAGLALSGVPFALTLPALVRRRLDAEWRQAVIPWLRAGWVVLAVGIITGSQWAYAELGWGGFWAWDPVENSSLLPWLATTIALHALAAPGDRLATTGAAAIVGGFCLMVSGVYVTRSGSTGSIHAFSESPAVGRPLLVFAAVSASVGIGALVYHGFGAFRGPSWARTNALALQSILGGVAVMTIAVGTFWPVVDGLALADAGTRAIVRPAYYHRVLAPIAAAALLALSVGPLLGASTRRPAVTTLKRVAAASALGAIGAFVVSAAAIGSTGRLSPVSAIVVAAAGAAIGGSALHGGIRTPPAARMRRVGVALAHGGFAIVILGAVTSSGGTDDTVHLAVGESVELDSSASDDALRLSLVELSTGRSGRFEYVRGVVDLDSGDGSARYEPELRAYERQPIPTAEAVIRGAASGDTIVVLESVSPDLDAATFTVRTRPLLAWVWLGAATAIVGGVIVALAGRRRASAAVPDAVPDRSGTATLQRSATPSADPAATHRR